MSFGLDAIKQSSAVQIVHISLAVSKQRRTASPLVEYTLLRHMAQTNRDQYYASAGSAEGGGGNDFEPIPRHLPSPPTLHE